MRATTVVKSCQCMESLFLEYSGQSSVFIGKKTKGEGEGRRMADWERGGGWCTGHAGSGMKNTQTGGGTRTSRPTEDVLVSC